MSAPHIISERLSFKGHMALLSITVSFIVMIVAAAIADGFRGGISDAISDMAGDIRISRPDAVAKEKTAPFAVSGEMLSLLENVPGVSLLRPAIYAGAIVRKNGNVHGVVFKGIETADTTVMGAVIPRQLATLLSLSEGDSLPAFFINETLSVRSFTVTGIYDAFSAGDGRMQVLCDIKALRRVNGWEDGQMSALEVLLDRNHRDEESAGLARGVISDILYIHSDEDGGSLMASDSYSSYRQIFDWLRLIDANVAFILVLMVIVAGLNMVSGLLILLFENISTIGLLKSMGMTTKDIAKTFLLTSSRLVFKGMMTGNIIGMGLCALQDATHFLRLNPANYFLSYVPVDLDFLQILLFDAAAYAVIMLILLIPGIFISKVDPAQSVRVK